MDDVRGLRALFRDPADAGGALGETGFDVKLGAGGIRDVEMVVQALQLLNAGKRPDLRERNTPRAFPRLVVAGLLGDREAWTLLSAYRFWRRLEHRVQVGTGAAGCLPDLPRPDIPGRRGPKIGGRGDGVQKVAYGMAATSCCDSPVSSTVRVRWHLVGFGLATSPPWR